jgi:hypothetical protein
MKRGSLARSMLKWSPRNLAVELTARLAPAGDGTAITLELQLNRTGHTIYGAEQYLHAWELKEAETYSARGTCRLRRDGTLRSAHAGARIPKYGAWRRD